MKRVGVDIRVLSTGRASGIEEYTEQLLAHMIPQATDVQWKLFYSGAAPLVRRPWMDGPNVALHETRRSNRLLWATTRLFGRPYLDELVGGADAFFFPHFLLGALSHACRRVMTWHDLSYERMPELLSWHRRFWHDTQMRPRQQALASDHIISVSHSTSDDIQSVYGIAPERISVIHSGIDPSLRRQSDQAIDAWRERYDVRGPFVLALGTREPRKNLPAVVRAWSRACQMRSISNASLLIAGPSGWMERELREEIAQSHVPERIRVIGALPHEERAVALSAASVLVYPSLLEGFGFPPLEAMACGTPVIASATSSVAEVVGDAGLLVDPYRVDSLANALIAGMSDAGLRSRLISKGYARSALYSWQSAAEQTIRVLTAAL